MRCRSSCTHMCVSSVTDLREIACCVLRSRREKPWTQRLGSPLNCSSTPPSRVCMRTRQWERMGHNLAGGSISVLQCCKCLHGGAHPCELLPPHTPARVWARLWIASTDKEANAGFRLRGGEGVRLSSKHATCGRAQLLNAHGIHVHGPCTSGPWILGIPSSRRQRGGREEAPVHLHIHTADTCVMMTQADDYIHPCS